MSASSRAQISRASVSDMPVHIAKSDGVAGPKARRYLRRSSFSARSLGTSRHWGIHASARTNVGSLPRLGPEQTTPRAPTRCRRYLAGKVRPPTATPGTLVRLPQPSPRIARVRTPKDRLTRSMSSRRVSGWSNTLSAASISFSRTRSEMPLPRTHRISRSARRAEPRTKMPRSSEGRRCRVRRMHQALTKVRSRRAASTSSTRRSRTLAQSEICAAERTCA